MRLPVAFLAALLATGAAAGETAPAPGAAPAHVEKAFLIPAAEGYGVGECLTGGASECGQVVADAWCEAQGFAAAASYGVAAQDEYTGAIGDIPAPRKAAERPIRITCKD